MVVAALTSLCGTTSGVLTHATAGLTAAQKVLLQEQNQRQDGDPKSHGNTSNDVSFYVPIISTVHP